MLRLAALSIATTLALSATAVGQDSVVADALDMDAPTLSETDKAEPDWYRQFTIVVPPSSVEDNLAIQSSPSEDFGLNWAEAGRWQFSFDMRSRPKDSPLPREEMSAGATFQITPRFSVGGDVSVGADELEEGTDLNGDDVEAGVRLRSAFRF